MNIIDLRQKQLIELLESLVHDYSFLLNQNDYALINHISESGIGNFKADLERIVEKVWEDELASGQYKIISWNKNVDAPNRDKITFATLSYQEDLIPFCNAVDGVEYKISYDSLLGACPKDAATLPASKLDDYTIAIIDGEAYSSYNGATRLITPKQLIRLEQTDYHTHYNELILDSKKIIPLHGYSRR